MRKPGGRPPHKPSDKERQQVQLLVAAGLTHDFIARIIGVSDETLRKHYRDELDLGQAKVVAQVVNSLLKKALGDGKDSVAAAKFYLERAAGWEARMAHKHEGDVGVTIQIVRQGDGASVSP